MTYLPPGCIPVTGVDNEFPLSTNQDLWNAVRMIEERWDRFFPTLYYYPLLKAATPRPTPSEEVPDPIVGEAGTTALDPIWGEAVDPSLANGGNWTQPIASSVVDPDLPLASTLTEVDQRTGPFPLKFKVQRVKLDSDLHKYGFQRLYDLMITIPTSMLDRAGIVCQADDLFIWDNRKYKVLQQIPQGYWYNTNIRLYVNLGCQTYVDGS